MISEIVRYTEYPMGRHGWVLIVVIVVIILGSATAGAYWYGRESNSPEAQAEKTVEETVAAVARHMILPEGETPTVARVSDTAQLEGQPFFRNAKVGQQVLIYTKAGKAILYDPELDRIVEASPLSVDI